MRRRTGGVADHGEWGPNPLEIEFEGEEGDEAAREDAQAESGPPAKSVPWWRANKTIGAAAVAAVLAVLALLATRNVGGSGPSATNRFYTDDSQPVRITYIDSYLVSIPKRELEVRLNVTPAQQQALKITEISVSEGGVAVAPVGSSSTVSIPAAGRDVLLLWTVTDCSRVPFDESMAYVEVITRAQNGDIMDRFTILGDRYSTDISRLLHQICGPVPAVSTAPKGPVTSREPGPLGTVS